MPLWPHLLLFEQAKEATKKLPAKSSEYKGWHPAGARMQQKWRLAYEEAEKTSGLSRKSRHNLLNPTPLKTHKKISTPSRVKSIGWYSTLHNRILQCVNFTAVIFQQAAWHETPCDRERSWKLFIQPIPTTPYNRYLWCRCECLDESVFLAKSLIFIFMKS